MNIVLIGMRCSGKTVVGRRLARALERDFLDTDALVERAAGCSVEEIVSTHGWTFFREMEKDVIREVSGRTGLVVATGGGVVLDEGNMDILRRSGRVVWLRANADVLRERMSEGGGTRGPRPSLTGVDPVKEIRDVLTERAPLYEKFSDLAVDTGDLGMQEVTASIIKGLDNKTATDILKKRTLQTWREIHLEMHSG